MILHLSFDIYGYKPNWAKINPNKLYDDSRYRIYIDNELIVERNWIWENDIYLKENVWIESITADHTLKLEPILLKNPAQAQFVIKNFKVNDIPKLITSDLEILFSV